MIISDQKLLIHIPNNLLVEASSKSYYGKYSIEKVRGCYDTFFLLSPINYSINITNSGNIFEIKGNANVNLKTNCSRCLDSFEFETNFVIDTKILINPKDNEELLLEYASLPCSHNINLGKILIYSLLLEVPEKPLCSLDCKGICCTCGSNLNKEHCCCQKTNGCNSYFSILKNYKFES